MTPPVTPAMTTEAASPLSTETLTPTVRVLFQAAEAAGLRPAQAAPGRDFGGEPTARLLFGSAGAPLSLEVSEGLVAADGSLEEGPLREGLERHLRDLRQRLRNPDPELYVTAEGLPLRLTGFAWPFHRSTSGADTFLVHGAAWLADGMGSPLHAKIAASMTVTFAEIVAAPEQPYAEDFIYNAVRRTFDYGQLELLKSGNRQPVPVTTRYYSRWGKKFQFTDTTERSRVEFLARKAFWLSGVHGGGAPVWLVDPRDAQYLNASEDELKRDAASLAAGGFVRLSEDGSFGAASAALMAREGEFRAELAKAIDSLKPAFNESMRAGQTNM